MISYLIFQAQVCSPHLHSFQPHLLSQCRLHVILFTSTLYIILILLLRDSNTCPGSSSVLQLVVWYLSERLEQYVVQQSSQE